MLIERGVVSTVAQYGAHGYRKFLPRVLHTVKHSLKKMFPPKSGFVSQVFFDSDFGLPKHYSTLQSSFADMSLYSCATDASSDQFTDMFHVCIQSDTDF